MRVQKAYILCRNTVIYRTTCWRRYMFVQIAHSSSKISHFSLFSALHLHSLATFTFELAMQDLSLEYVLILMFFPKLLSLCLALDPNYMTWELGQILSEKETLLYAYRLCGPSIVYWFTDISSVWHVTLQTSVGPWALGKRIRVVIFSNTGD